MQADDFKATCGCGSVLLWRRCNGERKCADTTGTESVPLGWPFSTPKIEIYFSNHNSFRVLSGKIREFLRTIKRQAANSTFVLIGCRHSELGRIFIYSFIYVFNITDKGPEGH